MKPMKFLLITIFCFSWLNNDVQASEVKTQYQPMNIKEQSIVTIVALTATGGLEALKPALNAGLDAGLTINEIKEILVQLYAYCGFPRSLNAINTFMAVLEERKKKGITDALGREASPVPPVTDKYEQGRQTLETLTQVPQPIPAKGYGEFARRIDTFLKEHLFADIFQNDILSHHQRELVTISALAATPGLEAQLKSHIGVGKNTGITDDELMDLAGLIEKHISKTQANAVRELIGKPVVPVIQQDIMVRIATIEILPEHVDAYKSILNEEAAASINIEPGVISIFPMYSKENPTQVRIVEIYANENAYQSHLQTPHFQHYKITTLKMVKTLKLEDMKSEDAEIMTAIFKKIR